VERYLNIKRFSNLKISSNNCTQSLKEYIRKYSKRDKKLKGRIKERQTAENTKKEKPVI
jgi:hypothetical protein